MRLPKLVISISFIAIVACGLWWLKSLPANSPSTPEAPLSSSASRSQKSKTGITDLSATFAGFDGNTQALGTLQDLQAKLRAITPSEAIELIHGFLKSGQDKTTGLPFDIGDDHLLKQWPTFRTFLIDSLYSIDPQAAARISREILAAPTTADEWALALRNIGLTEDTPATRDELRKKTEELITNSTWQAKPSIGYLNAFDVLVHTKAVESTPLLTGMIQRKDRKDLAHAAFLTLDRLVQGSPAEVLSLLSSNQALHQSRPEMTAQQFARADIRDQQQQTLVKSWLLDPSRSAAELNAFVGIYPNNNRFVSNNLVTKNSNPSGADLSAHDQEALTILQTWKQDPSFAPVLPHLESMIRRLQGFIQTPPE